MLVTLALQGGGAPLRKQEAVRALQSLLDPVSAAKLWRECAQLGLWAAAPAPPPPRFWAPWARPAVQRRVRTPHAVFANDDDDDADAGK